MQIVVNPIIVPTESGDVSCTIAEVSVAVSNSTAIRLVPVGPDSTEYPDAALGIVGSYGEPDITAFMNAVQVAVTTLAHDRGL